MINAVAVVRGVMTARLDVMMFGVAGMAMRAVGVVSRLFVIAGLVMLGGFPVMLGGMLVVLGGLVMMLDAAWSLMFLSRFGDESLRMFTQSR